MVFYIETEIMKSPKDQVERRAINNRVAKSPTLITNRSPMSRELNKQPVVNNLISSKRVVYQNQERDVGKLGGVSSATYSGTSIQLENDIGGNINKKGNNNPIVLVASKRQSSPTPFLQSKPLADNKSQQKTKRVALGQQQIRQGSSNLQNGDSYEGQYISGLYHGRGTYIFKAYNCKYEGEFLQGKQHGQGTLINLVTQQRVYEGNWQNGMKHGQGRYTYDSDQYYNGEWVNNQKHGTGVYHFKGGFYNGSWIKNKREGKGSLKLENGIEYKGMFSDNQFVRGFVRYPNGDEYSGQMKNNRRTGEGSYIDASSKTRFKGAWYNDKKNGKGTLTYENGDQITGAFVEGVLNQREVVMYRWHDGDIFNGWFSEGKPDKGTVSGARGEKWEI